MNDRQEDSPVRFRSVDGVGEILFDRPPANAYEMIFHECFHTAIDEATRDPSTRVTLIRSNLPRFFCAGADIKVFATKTTVENKAMVAAAQAALAKIEACPKPFIACIEGHALGGGLEIALACDARIGSVGEYQLGLPEARLGLLPGNGGSQRLPRVVGASQAFCLLASGESIRPEEAQRIGLLDRLYPRETFAKDVRQFALAIAKSAPLAVEATKRAIAEGGALPLGEALAVESRLLENLYDTADAKEGFNAFVEKRPPVYIGR
ncbi:MAG: enoyl-CoA hydratase/isomerase family protein [Rhodopirellula sp. JB044]|uniref:enoyl-CoA hydratase/isomerase family protein n=1 Tax=Rhodopirellula sp. JB044 TaxID=3342844 RepID=UPI00370C072D